MADGAQQARRAGERKLNLRLDSIRFALTLAGYVLLFAGIAGLVGAAMDRDLAAVPDAAAVCVMAAFPLALRRILDSVEAMRAEIEQMGRDREAGAGS